jgi:hypothetical protein
MIETCESKLDKRQATSDKRQATSDKRQAQFLTAHWKQPAAAQLALHFAPAVPFPDFSGAASSCIDACRACLHANAPHMSACGHACVFARLCLHCPSLICAHRSAAHKSYQASQSPATDTCHSKGSKLTDSGRHYARVVERRVYTGARLQPCRTEWLPETPLSRRRQRRYSGQGRHVARHRRGGQRPLSEAVCAAGAVPGRTGPWPHVTDCRR